MPGPLRVAVIGMGGFAATHHAALHAMENEGGCRVVCTCDPYPDRFMEAREKLEFAGRGVRLFSDYREMLDGCGAELDLVTIPTPIPLHAPMHHACVERGVAAYLEKPPTLNYEELDRMLEVETRAVKSTMVGFNYIVEPVRQALKSRLVAGEFGRLCGVSIMGHWPRQRAYFRRANWAGRLMLNGQLVLDSCMGNALAHIVHNGLFWGGVRDVWAWGDIEGVEAEMYRAHAIEGADTLFVKARIAGGVDLRVAMTHACTGAETHYERVMCDKAEITYVAGRPSAEGDSVRIQWHDGRVEKCPTSMVNVGVNLRAYCAYLRGEMPRPMTRLEDCRPFVELNNLAYIAAGRITTVPAACCAQQADDTLAISGIAGVLESFSRSGTFPSEQSLPWALQGGRASREDLVRLPHTIRRMADEAAC